MTDLALCGANSESEAAPTPVQLRRMHLVMVRIRRFEERAIQLFMAQEMPGFLGGIPIATGAALASRLRGLDRVAIAFFGDGALSQGSFHEAANMASVWQLPVVFVCENNLYAVSTHQTRQTKLKHLTERAQGYGFPGKSVDGNDPVAVYEAAAAAVQRARRGDGPTLLECRTYKWMGHYIGDPGAYRPTAEVAEWKAKDPLPRFEAYLTGGGVLSPEEVAGVHQAVEQELEAAIAGAAVGAALCGMRPVAEIMYIRRGARRRAPGPLR